MFEALHVYDDDDAQSAPLNMAADEALLNGARVPILRYYRWQRPTVSFGYFGCYAEVKSQSSDREIVRRWTGGGIVPHGEDLTYSIIVPAGNPLLARSSPEIYSEVHEAIRRALQSNGIEAVLANSPAPKISEACFANAVRADVLSEGRKIAGAAHRRSRLGLLHQGSIQRAHLPSRFKEDLARFLCERFESRTLSPETIEAAARIAETKYGTPEWLMRR
jgi:lipoyl(octanoyl) transferase